ncbi:hypothetical protein NDU88_004164 [Pleurodeles waltl]|uniref:Uncharacterized protein n=1 Tax=Pleurodeles waltl TaxID=8319 RepID=A0AAV7NLE4_PLEWA|nr:hypothetical protein NDU88_004164 [Pleurodeles waltl]
MLGSQSLSYEETEVDSECGWQTEICEPRTKRQNGRRSWTASRRPILNDLPPDVDAQGPGRREERRRAGAGPRGVGPRELVRRRYPDPQARLLTSRAASHAYPVALIRSRGGVRAA